MEHKRKTSQKNSTNYFKNGEGKKKAHFKLWVVYKDEYASKYPSNPFTYYGFNKLKDNGFNALMKLALEKKSEYKIARIYNNISGEQINQLIGSNTHQNSMANA